MTELKKRMRRNEEKVKDKEKGKELTKDRKDDDEKIRMRRNMMIKKDEARKNLIEKQ